MMFRIFYLSLCSLVVAGIVHITIILLIPNYGSQDAWTMLSEKNDAFIFRLISSDQGTILKNTDPYFRMGFCTFDLKDHSLKIDGISSAQFWSLSVFDQDGSVVYSLNNRSAIDNKLEVGVLSPAQMVRLREVLPDNIEKRVLVQSNISKGFVVVRHFFNDAASTDIAEQFIHSTRCSPWDL